MRNDLCAARRLISVPRTLAQPEETFRRVARRARGDKHFRRPTVFPQNTPRLKLKSFGFFQLKPTNNLIDFARAARCALRQKTGHVEAPC